MQALYYNTGSSQLVHLLGIDQSGSYTNRFVYSNITELIPCSSLQEIVAFQNNIRYAVFPMQNTNIYYTSDNIIRSATSSIVPIIDPTIAGTTGIFPINFSFSPSLVNTSSLDSIIITKNVFSSSGDHYATASFTITSSFDANTLLIIKNNATPDYFKYFPFFIGLTEPLSSYHMLPNTNLEGLLNGLPKKANEVNSGSNATTAAENLSNAINIILSGSTASSSLNLLVTSASSGTIIVSSSFPGTFANGITFYSTTIPINDLSASSIDYYLQNKVAELSGGTNLPPIVYTTESIIYTSGSVNNGVLSLISGESYNISVSGSGQFYTSSILITNTSTGVVELYATASNQYLTASFYPQTPEERTIQITTGVLPSIQLSWPDTGSMPYSNTGSLFEWGTYLQSQITIISSSSDVDMYFAGNGLSTQYQLNLFSQNINSCNLYGFSNLNSINISNNQLSSFINLDEAPNLVYYNSSNNIITGSIPDFTHANTISTILCSNNLLSGSVLGLNNLPYLSKLDCSYNFITGSTLNLSSSYGVTYLNFSNNQLSGGLEDFSIANSLQYYNCSNNALSGSISNLNNLLFLQELYVQNNILTGSIPDLDKTQIVTFDSSYNLLDGTIGSITSCSNLINFNCSHNQLTGLIPNLDTNTSLTTFDCSWNNLSGSIPNLSGSLNLNIFKCQGNYLTGLIPDLSQNSKLTYFDCNTNNLVGDISLAFDKVSYFNCAGNNLAGKLINIGNTGSLQYFYCNNNSLVDEIPNLSNYYKLIEFNSNYNNLWGSTPDLSNNNQLKYFQCAYNSLDGGINPISRFIIDFDCGFNLLTGSMPILSNSPNLSTFGCYNNLITGSIPDLSYNPELYWLRIDNNQLSGDIPYLGNNTILELFTAANNQLTGYVSGGMSYVLQTFDVSNNQLSQPAVDNILIDIDTYCFGNGTIDLSGGSNSAPSAAGLAVTGSLISKGWTLYIN